MKGKMPRILLAAPKSGSGKTMITCGLIEVLKRRKRKVTSFKCGPDYIDPMFHRMVLGIPSGNLDTFFTTEEVTRHLLSRQAKQADITVIEGVMGYYDGLGGQSERASTYEVAKVTGTPVILVVDAKGASVSLAAVIKGIIDYRKDSGIAGVLLNRVSSGYYERIKKVIEQECRTEVIGYIPELSELSVPSRHLGLVTPEEMPEWKEWIGKLADMLEKTVDVDRLLEMAGKAEVCEGQAPYIPRLPDKVRIAVAKDEAFSFYYTENLELLSRMGAELLEFSPLRDDALPEQIDGLLLGGGYPENYAAQLEAASGMRQAVKAACNRGVPCLAECGGFLYLQQELEGTDGGTYEMAGVLNGKAYRMDRLSRFGYIEMHSREPGIFGEEGLVLKGHEFHYWDCTENGDSFMAEKPGTDRKYPCMIQTNTLAAGFPHFYYYSNPEAVYEFLLACNRFKAGRQAKEHWDQIAKPIDSLGILEDYVVKICKMVGSAAPYDLDKRALVVLCGDHGVVAEGVTQTGQDVTKIVSENFTKGCSTVNHMAAQAGLAVYTVDMGMNTENYTEKRLVKHAVVDRKIARGTGNLAVEPAMTVSQCKKALMVGKQLVRGLKDMGYRILAVGEMGIGNTTSASVLAALLLQQPPKLVTGKGAGLSPDGMERKCQIVEQAVNRIKEKGVTAPLEILAEAGGYEIAGMAGIFLGAVQYQIPVVIDGAISSVAALAAVRMDERVKDFVLASHVSAELSGKLALEEIGVEAILQGRMCLGEGTGAAALFPILDMAMSVYRNMGSFTDYEMEPYERYLDV